MSDENTKYILKILSDLSEKYSADRVCKMTYVTLMPSWKIRESITKMSVIEEINRLLVERMSDRIKEIKELSRLGRLNEIKDDMLKYITEITLKLGKKYFAEGNSQPFLPLKTRNSIIKMSVIEEINIILLLKLEDGLRDIFYNKDLYERTKAYVINRI